MGNTAETQTASFAYWCDSFKACPASRSHVTQRRHVRLLGRVASDLSLKRSGLRDAGGICQTPSVRSIASLLLSIGVLFLVIGAGWIAWHRDIGFGTPFAVIGLILLVISAILFIRRRGGNAS